VGEDLKSASKLDMGITPKIEHCDLDNSKDISQETCEEKIKPTILDFDDNILSVEYESFLCGFDVNVSLNVDLCVEYASFSFDSIQIDFLFESSNSELVEYESIAAETFDLDQTLEQIELKGLVNLAPTILPRLLIHENHIFRPMTKLLAHYEYVCLFSNWAHTFENLKWTLTCALLLWWMYSFWLQLFNL